MQNQGRRRFLKETVGTSLSLGAGLASSSLFLSGCSSFDRVILGGAPKDPNEVLILGGGLAGLTTAYLCKKNGIPFTIFEGSSRVGGRILSLQEFNLASQSADLGGEWISRHHESVLRLAKELNVGVGENVFRESEYAFFDAGKMADQKRLQAELVGVHKKAIDLYIKIFRSDANQLSRFNRDEFKSAVNQDLVSCEELIKKWTSQSSQILPQILQRQVALSFGAEPAKVSSLSWLKQIFDQTEFSVFNNSSMFRISGGSQVLIQALYDRVAGVIPGRFINFSHKLVAVSQDSSGFELRFETPAGIKTVQTKRVVSTLPPQILAKIKGVKDLTFKDSVHQGLSQISAGDQAKAVLSFTERPWKRVHGLRRFSGSFSAQNFWESEPRATKWQQSSEFSQRSILTIQLGGVAAAEAGLHSVDAALQDLGNLKINSGFENLSQIQNWTRSPWAQGGRSYFSPGQVSELAGVFSEPQCDNRWLFAGESASKSWAGTMNGAVESAQSAFKVLAKSDSQKRS